MPDPPAAHGQPRWIAWTFALGLATLLGAVASGQHHVLMVDSGGDLTIGHALAMGMPYWYLWTFLAPLVIWFAGRVPLEPPRLRWRVAAHLGFAIILTLIQSVLEVGFRTVVGLLNQHSVTQFTQSSLNRAFYSLGSGLLVYGAILGTWYAFMFARRLREREMAASRLATQLAQARLEALRSQLKPHFFFNAMNTIAMLVRAQDNARAIRTISGMSDLLRHVLQEDPPAMVPLRDELAFIERYLEIEQIRFNDRLQVAIQADDQALQAMVPNLLLQPLVENAIRHGIGRRAGARRIEVLASAREGRLSLTVRDDGPGFSNGPHQSAGHGVGLRNTRARLQELFGGDFSLDLRDEPTGAVVSIDLPTGVAGLAAVPATA